MNNLPMTPGASAIQRARMARQQFDGEPPRPPMGQQPGMPLRAPMPQAVGTQMPVNQPGLPTNPGVQAILQRRARQYAGAKPVAPRLPIGQ